MKNIIKNQLTSEVQEELDVIFGYEHEELFTARAGEEDWQYHLNGGNAAYSADKIAEYSEWFTARAEAQDVADNKAMTFFNLVRWSKFPWDGRFIDSLDEAIKIATYWWYVEEVATLYIDIDGRECTVYDETGHISMWLDFEDKGTGEMFDYSGYIKPASEISIPEIYLPEEPEAEPYTRPLSAEEESALEYVQDVNNVINCNQKDYCDVDNMGVHNCAYCPKLYSAHIVEERVRGVMYYQVCCDQGRIDRFDSKREAEFCVMDAQEKADPIGAGFNCPCGKNGVGEHACYKCDRVNLKQLYYSCKRDRYFIGAEDEAGRCRLSRYYYHSDARDHGLLDHGWTVIRD